MSKIVMMSKIVRVVLYLKVLKGDGRRSRGCGGGIPRGSSGHLVPRPLVHQTALCQAQQAGENDAPKLKMHGNRLSISLWFFMIVMYLLSKLMQ